jgi:hypothetical protein
MPGEENVRLLFFLFRSGGTEWLESVGAEGVSSFRLSIFRSEGRRKSGDAFHTFVVRFSHVFFCTRNWQPKDEVCIHVPYHVPHRYRTEYGVQHARSISVFEESWIYVSVCIDFLLRTHT